jgi:hypothetical protein
MGPDNGAGWLEWEGWNRVAWAGEWSWLACWMGRVEPGGSDGEFESRQERFEDVVGGGRLAPRTVLVWGVKVGLVSLSTQVLGIEVQEKGEEVLRLVAHHALGDTRRELEEDLTTDLP